MRLRSAGARKRRTRTVRRRARPQQDKDRATRRPRETNPGPEAGAEARSRARGWGLGLGLVSLSLEVPGCWAVDVPNAGIAGNRRPLRPQSPKKALCAGKPGLCTTLLPSSAAVLMMALRLLLTLWRGQKTEPGPPLWAPVTRGLFSVSSAGCISLRSQF